jgi:hypothetical protein
MLDEQPGWSDISQSNEANVSVNATTRRPTARSSRSRRMFAGDGSARRTASALRRYAVSTVHTPR